jgi:hypothetical protein
LPVFMLTPISLPVSSLLIRNFSPRRGYLYLSLYHWQNRISSYDYKSQLNAEDGSTGTSLWTEVFFLFLISHSGGCRTYVLDAGLVYRDKMTCKGICSRHKAQKPVGAGRYATGQRRCQICEIFIKWDGLWCPCCGYRLRSKPRNLKYKAKLRTRMISEEAKRMRELHPALLVKPEGTMTSTIAAIHQKPREIGKSSGVRK